jgi:bifunctional DNase/RNase
VVVLRAHNEERFTDIWVGAQEGISIAEHIQINRKPAPAPGQKEPPPASQGLMAELVKALEGDVDSVNISLADHGYHATIVLLDQGITMRIDSRPGDAIGLALNFKAPVFVASELLKPTTLEQLRIVIREDAAAVAKRVREVLKDDEAKQAGKKK